MAFKNAFKIFVGRFGLVWSLILFLLLFALILGSLGLTIILPVLKAFRDAGIVDHISDMFRAILDGTAGSAELGAEIQDVWSRIVGLFADNRRLTANTVLWFFVIVFAYKFFLGFYELPLYASLEGAMSSNAKLNFAVVFVSKMGVSSRFVLVKIIYTTLYDAFFYVVLYRMLGLFFIQTGAMIIAPILIFSYIVAFQSLRYVPLVFWGPAVTIEKTPIFKSLGLGLKKSAKHFPSVFFSLILAWTVILFTNLFIGIFTFGVGLIFTIPASMLFVCILNMTLYYGKAGKRYYTDDAQIVTPPSAGISG